MRNGAVLANSGDISKRRALDFYPTPSDVTQSLLDYLKLSPQLVWEPACGEGAMSDVLIDNGHMVISSDLAELGYGMGGIDFLYNRFECHAIITNPPFNASERFIRHALGIAPTVAMLLKSQYWHAAKRVALFKECPPSHVLALTWRPDFMNGERGGSPTMDCIWTVWTHGITRTHYDVLPRPHVTRP